MNEDKDKTLDAFTGWDNQEETPDIDFFGESNKNTTKAEEVVDAVVADKLDIDKKDSKQETEEEEKKAEKKKEEVLANEVFSEFETDKVEDENLSDESKSTSKEKQEKVKKIATSITTANYLKEKGIVDYELEEGQELNDELAEQIIEDKFEETIESRVKELFEDMPPLLKQLNKFVIDGGDMGRFFKAMSSQQSSKLTSELDITVESNQELVMREALSQEGDYDEDDIETHIQYLKDSKKLSKIAEKKFDKWKEAKDEETATALKAQEERKKLDKQNRRNLKKELSTHLKDIEESPITFSSKDKRELPSYMTDKSVKLKNGNYITEMQKDLHTVLQDKEKATILAKLVKNGFDFKDIVANAETKVTKKAKEVVRRSEKETPVKSQGSSQTTKKVLADYF